MLVDIHCHILPGVDDGAPDMETSRAMIRDAYEQGVRYIIATPHYRPEMFEPSMKKVIRVYHELRDYAEEVGIVGQLRGIHDFLDYKRKGGAR